MRPATRNPVVIIALLASLMLIGATPLAAAWIADGTALAPLPPAADSASPAAHQHLDGSVVVAWTDYRSGFADVYAQRIGSHGSPLWSPGGVPVCSFSNTQVNPVICRGSEGPFDRGAIIAWEDGRNGSKDIYAQRLDTSGSALWQADGRPVCTGVADAYSPVIIPESPSGCIVAWIDERDGHPGIYAQKLDGNGSPLWDTNGVPLWTNDRNYTVTDLAMVSDLAGGEIISASLNEVYDDGVCILSYLCVRVDGAGARLWENRGGHYSADNSSLLYSHSSSLSPDGAGGAFITWARSTDHWSEVDSDRLSATGVELWTTNIEGEDTVDRQAWAGRPATARGAEGSLFITWRHDSIRAQKLDANGVPQWGTGVQALPPTAGALRLALDTASDIALIGTGMRAQALAGDGSLVWPASGVIINAAPGTHALAEVSLGVGGTLFACWTDGRYDPNLEVYAQKVGGDGSCLWGPDGVSVSPGDNQEVPWLAPDGLGGGIAVWQDERGEGLNIMAQRLDGAGNTLWPSTGAAVCDQLATQAAPVAVPDAAGGVIVAWTDYRAAGADIYAQRLDSSGAAQWAYDGVVVCDAWDRQESATAVADGGGGAIVAWLDYRNGGVDIYAQRLSAQGPQWTDDGVAVTLSATAESNVRLVADGAGGAILVWEDLRSGTAKVYAQRLSATGLPLWPSGAPAVGGRPVCSYAGAQSAPTLCPDGYQGAIIAWQDGRSATPALFAQRVDGAGDLVWPADGMPMTLVSAYAQRSPLACQDGGGGAIIAWNDYRDGRCDIFAQRVSGGGAKLWGDAGVGVCSTGSLEASGVLVPDYVGGMSAAWVAENGTTGQDIYVQGVNSAGTPAWSAPGLLICDASGDQHSLRGESDGSGGALFVWTDERSGGRQVFAHRHQNALCRVTPEILAFGTVAVGSVVAHEFVIENVGSTEFTGEVTTSCEAFTVISGAGPYVLGPGQSRAVSIAFQPAAAGSYSCTIQTGSGACAGISCTGTGSDLSWAGLQGPATVSAQTHSPTPGIYGRARIVGVTELAGATEGLVAQLGYGPPDSLPYGAGGAEGWTWIEAAWHADNDGCDEFMGALTVHLAGEYDYCYRFSLNGSPWVYGDLDGSANGYSPSQAGLATITTVDVARLDTASAETELGNTALILGRIHIEGVTGELNVPDLHGQVGFGPRGSDPRASPEAWHWSDANRFDIVYEGGSYHHLYEGGVTPPLTGEYAICCRFSYLDWPWLYGDLDGSLNGYSSTQEGVLTVHGAFNSAWTGYAGILFSGVEWGDYDGDGDLDILAGSLLWRNDGWGVFTAVATGMTGGMLGSSSWGDLDGDGDLDVVLTGDSGTEVALYRNDGGDVFTRMPSGMPALTMGSLAALADCDNDGDLDLLLSGASGGSRVSNLYINQGSWNFTSVATGLPGVSDAAAAWGDYDGDGDLDLILTGYTGSAAFTGLYRNDGGGSFAVVETDLPTVYSSGVAWGDYDGDGDLDILLAGNDGVQSLARVYRNNGAGSFSNIGAALPASTRAVGWGDYDNDGDLDLLLVSPLGVYRNDGAGAFQLVDAQFAGAYYSGQWGDSDNDGDLDILLSTFPEGYPRLYQNNGLAFNTPPAPPQNATASVLAGSLTLSWDAASDEQTPASGLSYQLRLGLTPGGNEILPALADATGYRRVARMGSAQLRESWTVTLPSTWDAIYWSVQAVDGAYAGSAFAAEQVVTREFTDVTSGPLGDVGNARGVAWGDYDSDGNQDLYLANGGQGNRLFHNEGNGTFVDATAGPLGDSANNAGVAWGDYENGGALGLVRAWCDG